MLPIEATMSDLGVTRVCRSNNQRKLEGLAEVLLVSTQIGKSCSDAMLGKRMTGLGWDCAERRRASAEYPVYHKKGRSLRVGTSNLT